MSKIEHLFELSEVGSEAAEGSLDNGGLINLLLISQFRQLALCSSIRVWVRLFMSPLLYSCHIFKFSNTTQNIAPPPSQSGKRPDLV